MFALPGRPYQWEKRQILCYSYDMIYNHIINRNWKIAAVKAGLIYLRIYVYLCKNITYNCAHFVMRLASY